MYTVSTAYRQALNNSEVQHIKGIITLTDGSTISIPDQADISNPSIRLQCTSVSDTFMIGQLYTGTLDFTLIGQTIRREKLRGGTVTLFVGVGDLDEWVPLGVWNITDPQRGNKNETLVKCVDNTSKLDVPIEDETVGTIKLVSRLKKVKALTGVSFEGEVDDDYTQVIANLSTIAGKNMGSNSVYGSTFCSTCRAEIVALAQYIGGMAYINREGKIAFRAFAGNSSPTIDASRRFKVNLAEYSTEIGSISYTFKRGNKDVTLTTDENTGTANTKLRLNLSENPYIWQMNDEDKLTELNRILLNVATIGTWLPGEFDYYGDPTFDLGDKIILAGGVVPESVSVTQRYFLITGICWQFRGPQTLISAGAGTTTSSNTSTTSSGTNGGIIVSQQASISAADIDFYRDQFTTLTEIGEVMIATSEDTIGIVQITVQIQGTANAENEFRILRDGIMQTTCSCDTTANAQKRTVSLTAVLDFTAGIHIISVEAKGSASILRAIGTVYGQGIQEYTGNPTFDSDYTAPSGVINRYLGSDIMPRIPSQISGSDVNAIDGGAFLHSEIKYANIPDGTEEVL